MSARIVRLKSRPAQIDQSATPASVAPALPSAHLGTIVGIEAPHGVWIEAPGLTGLTGRTLARVAIATDVARLNDAIEQRRPALLTFEQGDATRPILIGIIMPIAPAPAALAPAFTVEADADGQRVRVDAQEELVLQSGEASLTLQRNGRIVIRGSYVESRATGVNRLRGGSIRIN